MPVPRSANSPVTVRGRSSFEIIVGTFQYLKVGRTNVHIELDGNADEADNYLLAIAKAMPQIKIDRRSAPSSTAFGRQIIFDSADVACAFSQLETEVAASKNPWRIRDCWIQESLRDKFMDRFHADVSSSSDLVDVAARYGGQVIVAATGQMPLVIGVPAAQWPPHLADHVILVHFFRTAAEVLKLLGPTDSCSVWTENVSLAYELVARLPNVPNVWINSNGHFIAAGTFEFAGQIYGGEMGLVAAAVASADSVEQTDIEPTVLDQFKK